MALQMYPYNVRDRKPSEPLMHRGRCILQAEPTKRQPQRARSRKTVRRKQAKTLTACALSRIRPDGGRWDSSNTLETSRPPPAQPRSVSDDDLFYEPGLTQVFQEVAAEDVAQMAKKTRDVEAETIKATNISKEGTSMSHADSDDEFPIGEAEKELFATSFDEVVRSARPSTESTQPDGPKRQKVSSSTTTVKAPDHPLAPPSVRSIPQPRPSPQVQTPPPVHAPQHLRIVEPSAPSLLERAAHIANHYHTQSLDAYHEHASTRPEPIHTSPHEANRLAPPSVQARRKRKKPDEMVYSSKTRAFSILLNPGEEMVVQPNGDGGELVRIRPRTVELCAKEARPLRGRSSSEVYSLATNGNNGSIDNHFRRIGPRTGPARTDRLYYP